MEIAKTKDGIDLFIQRHTDTTDKMVLEAQEMVNHFTLEQLEYHGLHTLYFRVIPFESEWDENEKGESTPMVVRFRPRIK